MTEQAFKLRGVGLRRTSGPPILEDIDWQLGCGQLGYVVGASGSGKTRLLRLLNRLDERSAGSIQVLGRDIEHWPVIELRRQVGWVAQRPALGNGTARESLDMVIEVGGVTPAQFADRLHRALAMARVPADLLPQPVALLSAGERHRFSLARALLLEPRILVLDEPTSSLDSATAIALFAELDRWRKVNGSTVLLVTHRLEDLAPAGELLMLARGRAVHCGAVDDLLHDHAAGPAIRALLSGSTRVAAP